MAKLEEKYAWNTVYIDYFFTQTNYMNLGFVSFSPESTRFQDMTFGGETIISDTNDEGLDLFSLPTINPFLDLDLSQISFKDVLLQEDQIFVQDFSPSISIIPACAATHMPSSIYHYMETNFFRYICKGDDSYQVEANRTSIVAPLKSCQCNGLNFYGMPTVEFSLTVDQYETTYAYKMNPEEYEMLPRVNSETHEARCSLGLWNL